MMYCQIFRNLVIFTGYTSYKFNNVTRSFSGILKLPLSHSRQNYKNHFTSFRSHTTFLVPNKREIAEKRLKEFLQDPVLEKQYKVVQLELDVMRQSGENVPNILTPRHWVELLQLDSRSKRRKYINFVFGVEKKRENFAAKKKSRASEVKEIDTETPLHLQYRLGCNSLFLRLYDTTINQFHNWKLIREMIDGQKIVIDCGYENIMTKIENKNCARQLQLAFAANRAHDQPFDLYYCNVNKNGFLHEEMHSYIPTMYQPDFPINITEKSYLELFDKQQLIYLTPNCNYEMTKFDTDAIYIIGGIVDKVSGKPLSMAKAKREGLRMAKLPIDRYLDFGSGSGKNLTLNQMINILADMRMTGDWEQALRHVPRRKLIGYRQYQAERRMEKMLQKAPSIPPQDYSIKSRKKFHIE